MRATARRSVLGLRVLPLLLFGILCFFIGYVGRGIALPSVSSSRTSVFQPPALEKKLTTASPSVLPLNLVVDHSNASEGCEGQEFARAREYFQYAQRGRIKWREGHNKLLNIVAFCRLWVPPLHGTGGLQYHAVHLYSQLAAMGHYVHVFVTGPPTTAQNRVLKFRVDTKTFHPVLVSDSKNGRDVSETESKAARLIVQQVPSAQNGEYSEEWYSNCFKAFQNLNSSGTLPHGEGFHVAHSESWAGVPNVYQIGLQMLVTWHGSMLDWFRNEINLIVHNYRMRGKMVGKNTVERMQSLGGSVAFEAYMLLTIPQHVVISDSAADDLKAINLISEDRVHLIYNGVNPQNFNPLESLEKRKPFLREIGAMDASSGELFVVGCGGRLEGIKGHHQLATAIEIVLRRNKNVVLLVAGTGSEAHRYEKLKQSGLRVFLLGMLSQEKLATFYKSLDVFVDPFYQHHGLNTVMLEAVLSGVPIIATKLASAKTTAPCDAFGRTFSLGSVDELAAAVEWFLAHPTEKRAIGSNARERAVKLFSSSTMAGRYETLLYDMLENPVPLLPITGRVVCRHTYPAMCYREPN